MHEINKLIQVSSLHYNFRRNVNDSEKHIKIQFYDCFFVFMNSVVTTHWKCII